MSSENMSKLTLHVRMSTGSRFSIGGSESNVTKESTVGEVKQLIAVNEGSDHCPVERQRLIFRGRILSENSNTLEQYGITENDAVLHLVKGSAAVPPAVASSSSPTAAAASNNRTAAPAPATTAAASSSTGSATMGRTGSVSGSFANLFQDPTLANMQNNPMMQQMLADPSFMQSMMNSPLFQNPDMLLNLMQANPQMRQLMDANPQLRHVLTDPQILQQTMQAMRDPSHMATMMRNQDLAMSQIENYPGGFNALRRMYEEVQEPMMEAMSSGAGLPSQPTSSSSSAAGASSTRSVAMPNPWGTSTPAASTTTTATNPAGGTRSSIRTPPTDPSVSTTLPNFSSSPNYLDSLMMGAAAPGAMGATPPPPELMEQTLAMLENPTLRNAITTAMLDNPQMMQQMMELNPQLRQLRQENPAMAQMLSNPQFLRTMMDPSVMRAMMTLQQSVGNDPNILQSIQTLQEALGGGTTTAVTPGTMFPYTAAGMANSPPVIPAGVPAPPVGGLDFSTLLQQTQNMNISHQQQQQQRRYDVLVSQLVDMGFDDREANLRALQATGGNINRAVDYLLENPSIPSTPITTTNSNNNNNEGGGTNSGDTLPDSTNNGQ